MQAKWIDLDLWFILFVAPVSYYHISIQHTINTACPHCLSDVVEYSAYLTSKFSTPFIGRVNFISTSCLALLYWYAMLPLCVGFIKNVPTSSFCRMTVYSWDIPRRFAEEEAPSYTST